MSMCTKITISGLICTGKTTVFKELLRILKWPYFSSSQFFRDYAQKHNRSLQKAEEQNEKITKQVDYHLQELVKKEGNLIIEGWMAGVMADDVPGVLRVLLTCNEQARIERFAKREDIERVIAKKRILERENALFTQLEKIHGIQNILDEKYYNCIIDTTHKETKEILASILQSLKKDSKLTDNKSS